jgi:thiosulfate/3-mercaptopyruvate sulfurtransferase
MMINCEMRSDYIMDPAECVKRLAASDMKIVDCRFSLADTEWGRDEFRQGHIPGACNMPFLVNMNDDGRWKSGEELKLRFADIMKGQAEQTIVYCGSGVTACHNILALEIAGFHGALMYPGSWSEWIASGRNPVASDYE